MTLERYLQRWLVDVAGPSVRPSTYRAYELNVRAHLVPALGRKRLDRLAAADVRQLLNAKAKSGLSVNTVRQMHAVLRNALEQAMRDDLVVRNVAKLVRAPSVTQVETVAFDEDEARRLLAAAKEDRLFALWAVAFGIGLRKGEAFGLRWQDVDLKAGELRIRQSSQRITGRGVVLVPVKTNRSGGRCGCQRWRCER